MKLMNVIDEFTREALAIEVDRSIGADGVAAGQGFFVLKDVVTVLVRFVQVC